MYIPTYIGVEFNAVIDLVLSCVQQTVIFMPLEHDVIVGAAQCLVAFSASKNPARLRFIVASEHINALAKFITATSGNTCRLSGTGLASMFEALGQIFVRAGHDAYFTMVQFYCLLALFFTPVCLYVFLLYIFICLCTLLALWSCV